VTTHSPAPLPLVDVTPARFERTAALAELREGLGAVLGDGALPPSAD
jgi:hypothetical protein